ncbi:hypothetical protein AAFG07_04670 [Bradyrhizobium sp. B097]|uniref:hypothetical protein n=1 Tax=Bradyrhizobium sp. B097 TaxID=3140244 RepID=UPI00318428E5
MRNPPRWQGWSCSAGSCSGTAAFAMALTRIPEVNDAVVGGDIYVGGLAGEDWSRLMHNFG